MGEAKLWQAWWLYGVMFGIVIMLLTIIFQYYAERTNNVFMWSMCFVSLFIVFFHTTSSPYVVWKCSGNSESKGWISVSRIVITLSPFLTGSLILNDANHYKGHGVLISFMCSLLIILFYLSGKISKSQKLLLFNHKYVAPILLVVSNMFIFLASNFAL